MNKIVKRFFLTILILFILSNNIKAFEKQYLNSCPLNKINKIVSKSTPWEVGITSNLYKDLSFTKQKTIDVKDGALQGFTLTDKYLIFAHWINNYSNTNIYILDKKTFAKKSIISKYFLGHANDLAYNFKTNNLLISNNYYTPTYILSSFDIKDDLIFNSDLSTNILNSEMKKFNQSTQPFITNKLDIDTSIYSNAIAYDSDHNQYIIFSYLDKKIHITDDNFNDIRDFSIIDESIDLDPTTMTSQGIGYWNNHIYYTTFESGRPSDYQSSYNYYETSTNLIYVFDLYGNLDRILYIPTSKLGFNNLSTNYTATSVELESISFYNDGTMLLGFNIYNDYYTYKNNNNCNGGVSKTKIAFYTSDSLKRDYLNVKNIKLVSLPKKLKYKKNEKLDLSGGILKITYFDGVSEELDLDDSNISVTGFNSSEIGVNTLEINYGSNTTTFDITIIPK